MDFLLAARTCGRQRRPTPRPLLDRHSPGRRREPSRSRCHCGLRLGDALELPLPAQVRLELRGRAALRRHFVTDRFWLDLSSLAYEPMTASPENLDLPAKRQELYDRVGSVASVD